MTAGFDITIKGMTGQYTVEARGPKGSYTDPEPFLGLPTSKQLNTLANLRSAQADVSPDALRELGQALYRALFVPAIATAFGRAQALVGSRDRLRLCLRAEPAELAALPWELLHDGWEFLALQSEHPFVRIPSGRDKALAAKKLPVRGALRILFISASPQDLPALHLEKMAEELGELLREAQAKRRVVFDVLPNATLGELRIRLLQEYHVLCFAGHGCSQGIFLDDGNGETGPNGLRGAGDRYLVSAATLAREVEGKSVRVMLMAACDTSEVSEGEADPRIGFAEQLAREGKLPAVIGMQYDISNRPADELTARFLEALAEYCPVDVALTEARKALILPEQPMGQDVFSPVIYLQTEDAALFQKAHNWAAWGLAVTALLLPFLILLAVRSQQQTVTAQQTASVESERRMAAQATAQAEVGTRTAAQATAGAERISAQSTAVALSQSRATAEAQASSQARMSESNRLAAMAISQIPADPELSVLLATQAVHLADTNQAKAALRQSITESHIVRTLRGHTGGVNNAIFSPDGAFVLTVSDDQTARLWEVSSGHLYAELRQATGALQRAGFSADGKRFLALAGNRTAWIWEIPPNRQAVRLIARSEGVDSAALSPDGRFVVGTDLRGKVTVHEVATGKEIAVMSGHHDQVFDIAISSDGQFVVSAGHDDSARVWKMATGQLISTITNTTPFDSSTFSPDGRYVASVDDHGGVSLWEANTGKILAKVAGFAPAFSPDGARVATVDGRTARVWMVSTGTQTLELRGHKEEVTSVAFSSDGRFLVTGSADNTARVWNVTTGEVVTELCGNQGVLSSVQFSPGGDFVVTASADQTARLWDTGLGDVVARLVQPVESVGSVTATLDARYSATVLWDGSVGILDRVQNRIVGELSHHTSEMGNVQFESATNNETFSVDGQRAVTVVGNTARVWEPETHRLLLRLGGDSIEIVRAIFSPTDKHILTYGSVALVWDAATGRVVATLPVPNRSVIYAAFSSGGKTIVTVGFDEKVRVWETDTGRLIGEWPMITYIDPSVDVFTLPDYGVYSASFRPDGKLVAAGNADSTVRVWEVGSGQRVAYLPGQDGAVTQIAYSADGRWIATEGAAEWTSIWTADGERRQARLEGIAPAFTADGRYVVTSAQNLVHVWDVDAGQRVMDLRGPVGQFQSAVLTPNGEYVVARLDSGKVLVYRCALCVPDSTLLNVAASKVTRDLTCAERKAYLHDTTACPSAEATLPSGTVVAWGYAPSGRIDIPGDLNHVTRISAGTYHSVALKSDGTVVAWGINQSGAYNAPAGLSGVKAVAAGIDFSLALRDDGSVVGWGANGWRQLNVPPEGLSEVMDIAAGATHALALRKDGTVVAWGSDFFDQTDVPVGLNDVKAIAAGNFSSFAVKNDGTVVAWGCGDGSHGDCFVPKGLTGVTAVAAGESHALALKDDGTVVAWGCWNGTDHGQCGVPAGLTDVKAIAAAWNHSLALKRDGTVVAWGNDDVGSISIPPMLSGVLAISTGRQHSVAIRADPVQ